PVLLPLNATGIDRCPHSCETPKRGSGIAVEMDPGNVNVSPWLVYHDPFPRLHTCTSCPSRGYGPPTAGNALWQMSNPEFPLVPFPPFAFGASVRCRNSYSRMKFSYAFIERMRPVGPRLICRM